MEDDHMSWDPTWEHIFSTRDWGRYPPEELIRFVARNFFFSALDRSEKKILEIGCGTGANIWFLAREGFDTYGIDGSPTAIAKAEHRLQEEGLKAHLQIGDIASLNSVFPAGFFDAVIDVACLQHNDMQAVPSILNQVLIALKPQGRIFSMMVATGSSGDGLGREVEPGTYVDIGEGPLQNMGLGHFFSLEEVQRLFGGFNNLAIEYSTRSLNNRQDLYKHWVVEGVRNP
jgi:SAM-dependent methyltransferase